MSYEVSEGTGVAVKGVGTTVDQGSTYLGDGDSTYWVVVAVPGGEETDGEGFTFKSEGTGWYPPKNFFVDAPQEALDTYAAIQAAKKAAATARYNETVRLDQMAKAREPYKGRTVEVVRGRKVPIGTVAEVAWYGDSKYGYYAKKRVGLLIDGEKVFTDAYNVQVVNPEQYAPEVFAEQAAYEAVAA